MDDKIVPLPCVYLGLTETSDSKIAITWLPVGLIKSCKSATDAENIGSSFTHKTRQTPSAIGTVYLVKGVLGDDGRLKKAAPDWQYKSAENQHHINSEWIAAWETRTEAIRVAQRARKELAAIAKDDKVSKLLRPLRLRYNSTDYVGRLALEVVVLSILRRP